MAITANDLTADSVRAYVAQQKEAKAVQRHTAEIAMVAERAKLHRLFQDRELKSEALEHVAALVQTAVDAGESRVLLFQFPSEWLPDHARAIIDEDEDWPGKLTGAARRAYDGFWQVLAPRGFQIRAAVLDWPHGKPGDVGLFLQWQPTSGV